MLSVNDEQAHLIIRWSYETVTVFTYFFICIMERIS